MKKISIIMGVVGLILIFSLFFTMSSNTAKKQQKGISNKKYQILKKNDSTILL